MNGSIGKSGNALGEIGSVLIFGENLWYTLNAIVTHSLFVLSCGDEQRESFA